MHFGLHLIRKVIRKKSFLIYHAYHSRVFETGTDSDDRRERCVCDGRKGGGWDRERRLKKGEQIRWDWYCHGVKQATGEKAPETILHPAPQLLHQAAAQILLAALNTPDQIKPSEKMSKLLYLLPD